MKVKIVVAMLAVVFCLVRTPSAQPAEPAEKTRDQIRAEIEALQDKIEALEREAHTAEEVAEQKEMFGYIQTESRERMAEYAERLMDIRNEEAPESETHKTYVNALISHIETCRRIDGQILALKDYTSLAQARKLQQDLELAHAEWEMETEPALEMKARLAELQMTAREIGDVRLAPIVGEIALLHERIAALGTQQLEIWKARRKAQQEMETRIHQFWQTVENLEHDENEDDD